MSLKLYLPQLIIILTIIIIKIMSIFSKKTPDQKIKDEFMNEKKAVLEGKETEDTFLSIPISNKSVDDSNNNFLYFNNSVNQAGSPSDISPAMYDLIHKLELAVKSGKIDNESIDLFNQATKLCSFDQISKISPVITAPTLQLFVEKSKELGKETSVIENNMGQNQDQNLAKNPANNPSDYMSDYREFMRERQNPLQAQQELINEASLENDNSKKI